MKQSVLAVAVAMVGVTLAAAVPQVQSDAAGKLAVRCGNLNILANDGVTLQNAAWKTVESPMAAAPVVEQQGGATVTTWRAAKSQVVRTVRTLPDGAVAIAWEVEFAPGITDGKYIELTLVAPKNAWKNFPVASHRTIAESRTWIEVDPDCGKLYFDFSGSTGNWKFEEMRDVAWFGHLRLIFFSGYHPEKGTKFTAKLTVTPVRPAAARELPKGNGDEYARVVLPPEEKNAAPLLPARFRIETKKPLRRSTSRLFGYNNDWHGYDALRAVDPTRIDPEALRNPIDPALTAALAGVPTPLNRTAGTDSQLFRWRDAIGANRNRKPFSLWFGQTGGSPRYYGLVEHFSWYRQLHADSEFVYVVNLHGTSPEESRALAEFLTGGADTPLGAERIALGLGKPVVPAIWELGNEMDLGGAKHMELDRYLAACRAHIDAIRQACPDAVFAAHALSSPWDPARAPQWRSWNRGVLQALGPDLRYLAFHPYYRGCTPNGMLPFMDDLRDDIAASSNPSILVFNSEHAKWPPGYEQGGEVWKRNWYQTHALIGVLDTAEWLLLMLNRPEVGAQTYHAFSAGPWGVVYRDRATGKFYTTGIAELFGFFGEPGYDNTVVVSELEGVGTNPRALPFNLTGAAELSPDGKTLFLTLNNRLPASERELELVLDDPAWQPVAMRVLSAPALESVNTLSERPIQCSTKALDPAAPLRIPAKSLVRITLTAGK